jgi:putative ABC transport system permease protein
VGSIFRLALQSLRSRAFTSLLTVASIALSVTLLVGIEHVRAGVRESFAGTIRGVDLIVGARGGTLQILLSSVFGIGAPSGSVSMATYERWANHPAVSWTIPYSLGDSHRGYRVIGTTNAFYERYRYRQDGRVTFASGGPAVKETDVVIGAEVAERLRYAVGSPIVVTHGLQGGGIADHDAHPFTIVGVLNRTFTPIDRAIYVTLEGIEAMHEDFEATRVAAPPAIGTPVDGAPPSMPGAEAPPATPGYEPPPGTPSMPGYEPPPGTPTMPGAAAPALVAAAGAAKDTHDHDDDHDDDHDEDDEHAHEQGDGDHAGHDHAPSQISAFFVGTKNRFEALQLQREMNTDLAEPLTAVIPGVSLGELWQNIASAEVGLRIVAFFAVAIGLTGMLVALYSSLDARRREMAILRAVGAGPRTIVTLLVFESALLALLGCVIGVALVYVILALGQGAIEARSGVHLALRALGSTEWQYLALVLGSGTLIGFVPALKAYRNSLSDGLAPRS